MKNYLSQHLLAIALLCALLLIVFQALATPALAADPSLAEELWTSSELCAPGRCGGGRDSYQHIFTAPPGAAEVEVEVWWAWDGHPGQIQKNEHFSTSIGIKCDPDPGDDIPPQLCGKVRFPWSSDLGLTVTHLGYVPGPYGQEAGSVHAHIIVRWYGSSTTDPICNSVNLSIPDGSQIPATGTTINLTINAANTTQYQLIRQDNGQVVAGPQADPQFQNVPVVPHVTYQVQVRNDHIGWLNQGCTFRFNSPSNPTCDNATARIDPQTMQVAGSGSGQGIAWRVVDPNGQVMASGDGAQASFSFTAAYEISYQLQFQNRAGQWSTTGCQFSFSNIKAPTCNSLDVSLPLGSQIPEQGASINLTVNATAATQYQLIRQDNGQVVAGPQADPQFQNVHIVPHITYRVQVRNDLSGWSTAGCHFSFNNLSQAHSCTLTALGENLYTPGAVDEVGNPVAIKDWMAESNFDLSYADELTAIDDLPITVQFPDESGKKYWVQFSVLINTKWLGGEACRLEHETPELPCLACGQYQDFVGAVPFGTFTPYLEPGKEYFDGTRSVMFNVEYLNQTGQGEVVFRFNGQEVSGVTTSLFHAGASSQIESINGRGLAMFNQGVTKLIAYRYGAEQARIFQTMSATGTRWIHPLDQPFEHKYEFALEIYGSPNATDILVYGDSVQDIHYDETGRVVARLTFTQPGLVAIYRLADAAKNVAWLTVGSITAPSVISEPLTYDFGETGLYHYRLIDNSGQVVAGPQATPHLTFKAKPNMVYQAQLVYPDTSIFVGLYDDMKFKHPAYWTMPVDARFEHDFEFLLDYHRLNDPDPNNDHLRSDVVVDALYLTNGTTSVAQQFPYGRHDGSTAGVKIVGIPNVSMIAFCQRPGVHEVVYWGGWENESYYLPDRGWIFDDKRYGQWNDDQRGDCIDAAHRVNMLLAREGLRTDHTYRHHGERSQGYQMVQQHIWSAYNLVGMRPPHLGQLLKPGTVLPYYEAPEALLFWGWDLDKGGLAEDIGAFELQQHVALLGPVVYGDQTGIHPPEKWYVPELPTRQPAPQSPAPQIPVPQPPAPQPTPEVPASEPPAPEPTPEPAPVPPVLDPSPAPGPTT
jgi:hypothetical protein